ncbi:peptidylprolyl isomerase [Sphingomonas beigongshangi]|uniref:peptidylprolyl isomerase n=1 Tax=Sphingomonas beigongshangi TaxID=2782540 RepID=UPI00193C6C05|nr:peptidylprolyl isomerase [Sphingomonas beigongshangi]
MLSFFRRIINSKAGVIVTFVVLGVIAIAFAAGDVTGLRGGTSGGLTGNYVVKVGGEKVSVADLESRMQSELQDARQQQPTITMADLIAQGGMQAALDRSVNSLALDEFGHDQGMIVSKRAVDGQIASIPGLRGPNGQFDPAIYQQLLQQRRLTDAQVRSDIARGLMAQQLILPTQGATQFPQKVALPYASLLLEKRDGRIGFIPAQAMDTGAAPSDAEIQAAYRRGIARYTVPQRRTVRYAIVTPDQVKARVAPTDQEIAQVYNEQKVRYAAVQKRDITQVVVLDQAGANALAAKVKGGAALADAARAAGLEPSIQKAMTKDAYRAATSAAAADAVFGAAKGAVVGPVRGALGWIVARVDTIADVPGKTLEQARPEIVAELTKQKQEQALRQIHDALDDSLARNTTFDEAVADQKLTGQQTQPLLTSGINPDAPGTPADPKLAPIVAAAFQMQEGDAAQLVPLGQDGGFALVALGRITPATPRPLAQVRDAVVADIRADRARAAARTLAAQVLAKVNKGMPLAQALAGAGRALPPPQAISAVRGQLAANPRGAQPGLVLMFSMVPGSAKMLEAPNKSGWLIVDLDRVTPGDARGNAQLVTGTRQDLARIVGREYVDQFARAVRNQVGVKTDTGALARVRAELSGANPAAGN